VSSSTVNGPKVGIAPKLSDSELLTLAVMQAMLSFSNETQWLRYAKNHLTTLPVSAGPTRIQQATARRSVDAQGSHPVPGRADGHVHRRCVGGRLDPVECGRSTQTAKRSDLAGWAGYGYCASHSRYFWGLRLHLVCTLAGVPITFALTHPKDDEREVLMGMFQVEPALVAQRPRQTVIGDKNYFGREFEDRLRDARIRLLRPARKGETERPGSSLFKPLRQIIESINQTLKSQLDLEHHGGRTIAGVTVRVLQRILALTAAIWHNQQTGRPVLRSLTACNNHLIGLGISGGGPS